MSILRAIDAKSPPDILPSIPVFPDAVTTWTQPTGSPPTPPQYKRTKHQKQAFGHDGQPYVARTPSHASPHDGGAARANESTSVSWTLGGVRACVWSK